MVRDVCIQSDIGLIPQEWRVLSLEEIADVKTGPFGSILHAKDYVQVGTPIITVEHLGENSITRQNLPYVSDYDKKRLASYVLRTGDIVFSRVGSVDRNAHVTNSENGWLFSGRLLRIRATTDELDAQYLACYFKYEPTRARIRGIAVGQTMASLNTKLMKTVRIIIPTFPEQHAIATALSDVDEYITVLEKLIAQKCNIKQGAMQELLTGKRRLPGFSVEWVEKKIDELGNTSSGGTPSRSIPTYFEGNIPWVTTSELKDGYIYTTNESITHIALTHSSAKLFPIGTVLMAMYGATIGKLGIIKLEATTNQACCAFFFHNEIDSQFMFSMLLHHRNLIIELGSGAGQPNISQSIIKNLAFKIPPQKTEQSAIAAVLSDMDAEIDGLTAKLRKAKQIKQGMMNELLTGRIRLL